MADWKKLGMNSGDIQITAPYIKNFQAGRVYSDLKNINVPVGGGGILLIKKK
jgi:hypothetical protein